MWLISQVSWGGQGTEERASSYTSPTADKTNVDLPAPLHLWSVSSSAKRLNTHPRGVKEAESVCTSRGANALHQL